jgi:enoyl-CoA hydratase
MAEDLVLYDVRDRVATLTMNRPQVRNAQNARLTHALDDAFLRAVDDDDVGCIVLAGAGKHFSAGHDIGTPERDIHLDFERRATTWWPHGACVAGALMLAWVCDLIVASEDAFFADPVVRMGIPGVEYFAHPFAVPPRIAKEMLFLGERVPAARAYEVGMINRVVAREELESATHEIATRIAKMPRFGLALTKRAVNFAEDRMGLRDSMDAAYGLHHLAHAHNALSSEDHLAGQSVASMKRSLGGD